MVKSFVRLVDDESFTGGPEYNERQMSRYSHDLYIEDPQNFWKPPNTGIVNASATSSSNATLGTMFLSGMVVTASAASASVYAVIVKPAIALVTSVANTTLGTVLAKLIKVTVGSSLVLLPGRVLLRTISTTVSNVASIPVRQVIGGRTLTATASSALKLLKAVLVKRTATASNTANLATLNAGFVSVNVTVGSVASMLARSLTKKITLAVNSNPVLKKAITTSMKVVTGASVAKLTKGLAKKLTATASNARLLLPSKLFLKSLAASTSPEVATLTINLVPRVLIGVSATSAAFAVFRALSNQRAITGVGQAFIFIRGRGFRKLATAGSAAALSTFKMKVLVVVSPVLRRLNKVVSGHVLRAIPGSIARLLPGRLYKRTILGASIAIANLSRAVRVKETVVAGGAIARVVLRQMRKMLLRVSSLEQTKIRRAFIDNTPLRATALAVLRIRRAIAERKIATAASGAALRLSYRLRKLAPAIGLVFILNRSIKTSRRVVITGAVARITRRNMARSIKALVTVTARLAAKKAYRRSLVTTVSSVARIIRRSPLSLLTTAHSAFLLLKANRAKKTAKATNTAKLVKRISPFHRPIAVAGSIARLIVQAVKKKLLTVTVISSPKLIRAIRQKLTLVIVGSIAKLIRMGKHPLRAIASNQRFLKRQAQLPRKAVSSSVARLNRTLRLIKKATAGSIARLVPVKAKILKATAGSIARLLVIPGLQIVPRLVRKGYLRLRSMFPQQPRVRSLVGTLRNRTIISETLGMSQTTPLFPAIDAGVEYENITFDFGLIRPNGVTVINILSVSCTVHEGQDTNPSSRLIGNAAIRDAADPPIGSGLHNAAVIQQVGNCIGGTSYMLQCVAQTADGEKLSLWGILPCQTPK